MPTLSGVESAGGRTGGRAVEPAVEPSLGRAVELEADEGSVEDDFADRTDSDRTRAFVKIQDGCSFHCTYCIIPRARGSARSVPADEVVAEVRRATAAATLPAGLRQ